jgi:predicted RNA binding protein YcfA (HicA-like mRNA interferase family)
MPKLPGVNHLEAIRALEKAGFRVVRPGSKHAVMSDGVRFVTIPRHNPVNAYTMGGIIRDAVSPLMNSRSFSEVWTWLVVRRHASSGSDG